MRALFLLIATCCILSELSAQTAPATYWVKFRDKAHTPYSLDQPEAYLAPRSIERRQRHHIAVDSLDLPVDPAYIQALLAAGDFELLLISKWFNAVTIRSTDTLALDSLGLLPFVAEVRMTTPAGPPTRRVDKFPGSTKLFEADYGDAYRQVSMMNGHLLHGIGGARGEGMLIGVLDSGFESVDQFAGFAHLRDRGGILRTRDVVSPGGNVFQTHNHGRMVLSIMAARINGKFLGTAPEADYVLVRTENADSEFLVEEDNWVTGAEYCDSLGCDVLNTSLGYTTFDDSLQDHTYAEMDGRTTRISIGAAIASSRGMIPVNSAGNSGDRPWRHISAPADAEGVLAVGAVRTDRSVADFSSRGPTADGRTKPDVSAVGQGTYGLAWDPELPMAGNGTSFSAPLVAGLTACLWQLHPEASHTRIMDAVRRSASHHDHPDNDIGHGIPDYWRAHLLLGGRDLTDLTEATVLGTAPSPFTDFLDVEVFAGGSSTVELRLHDATGRTAWVGSAYVEPETYARVRIQGWPSTLRSGMYLLEARIGGTRHVQRVLKVSAGE